MHQVLGVFVITWGDYENIKTVLEKPCSYIGFEFFENVSFTKKKVEHQKLNVVYAENLSSMIWESFILVLALYSCCGNKKAKYGLLSKRLKKPLGINKLL